MERLLRRVPGFALGAIECRLDEADSQVDLSFRLSHAAQARAFKRLLGPRYLIDFLESWSLEKDPRIPFLWLEFDLDQEPGEELHPFLLAKLSGRTEADWLAESLVPRMQAGPVSKDQRTLIARSLAALPVEASPTYISTLKARGQKTVRFDHYGLTPKKMGDYLRLLGRRDLAEALADPAELLSETDQFHLSHDFASQIEPRLGVEGSFAQGVLPKLSRWQRLLCRLTDAGLCSPAKRDAVLAWVGYDSPSSVPGLWPEACRDLGGFMVRSLSHVKIICHPEKPPEAKVYLLFGQYLRSSRGSLVLRDR
ncbi:MAG: hypothetical protein AAF725_09815 [Acidobacteriota bacterium]